MATDKLTLVDRVRRRRTRHKRRSKVVRGLTALGGVAITLIGAGLLVLPGPAFLVIPVGLSLLALEFDWAERLLIKALQRAEKAKRSTDRIGKKFKIAAGGVTFLLLAGGTAAAWIWRDEIWAVLNR